LHLKNLINLQKIQKSFLEAQDIIRKKVQSAVSSIHLPVDIWTSPDQRRHLFLAVVAHFTDAQDNTLQKALLGLPVVVNHSGDEQFKSLLPVLHSYGIVRKLGVIMGDNSSTNDTLCREISRHLEEEEDLKWDPVRQRLRCLGHIINLAVQAFLFQGIIDMEELKSYGQDEPEDPKRAQTKAQRFRLLGPLGKLHNIIVHTRSSSGHIADFCSLAERMVPVDGCTRWNSWYMMLEVALTLAPAIDAYSKKHFKTLKADYLMPDDWIRLRKIKEFLYPFYKATLETEGDMATIDRVLFCMDALIKCFDKSLVCTILFLLLILLICMAGKIL
jgi:hypothetical protein